MEEGEPMQVERLFEIVFILLHKEKVTAKWLAEKFEVSTRTIYRDLDTLSSAGIPIYTNKGNGGGISILEGFKLEKTFLSEAEQNDILFGLQCLGATGYKERSQALNKLGQLFRREDYHWIQVDFTPWGDQGNVENNFNVLRYSIIHRQVVAFDYYSGVGEKTRRCIWPYRLVFKGKAWYVEGYCLLRKAIRLFKLTRIRQIEQGEESFLLEVLEEKMREVKPQPEIGEQGDCIAITLWVSKALAYRIYDEFEVEQVKLLADGNFEVNIDYIEYPEEDWFYNYLLSFGKEIEVKSPESVRVRLKEKIEAMLRHYS